MAQMLLFPDPRPLVERLGADFFRQAPQCTGVYLMRDAGDTVLYVGKAKNLRKRLASYRVANPDRMRRRQLRLLRAVARIELQECADESCALAREAELLRSLRPRFNRAGTWPGRPWFLGWKLTDVGLHLVVRGAPEPEWKSHGPLGAGAFPLRATLLRLLWCALYPERGLAGLPAGWFSGRNPEVASIPGGAASRATFEAAELGLQALFDGRAGVFTDWIRSSTLRQHPPFETAVLEADLEAIAEFAKRCRQEARPTGV